MRSRSTSPLPRLVVALLTSSVVFVAGCGTDTSNSSPVAAPTAPSAVGGTAGTEPPSTSQTAEGASSSSTTSTAALTPPVQESPLNGASDVPRTVTVRWQPSSAANPIYTVQIARDGGFSSLVANTRITDGSIGHTVFDLTPGTQYFWRVSLTVDSGTNAWSPVWSFRVTSRESPGVPTLRAPANGATGIARSPTLSWNAVPGAESYQVEITPFGTAYFNVQGTSLTLSEETLSLGYTDRHQWRVRAKNAAGTSEWSETWTFTRTP